jgi:hypothetical protein
VFETNHTAATYEQGPVFILELFGLCDVSVELFLVGVFNDCLKWTIMGAFVLCLPLACLALSINKCYCLRKAGDVEFKQYEHRAIRSIYTDAMQHHGLRKRVMTLLVDLHDKRFVGEWGKKSDEAKRWGFLLANTAGRWFCFSLPLIKKLTIAVIVNIPHPVANAALMTIVFWIDLFAGACLRGHRDHFVNFSAAVVAFGNCVALILTSVKVIMPALNAPQWLQGPVILMLTASMTAIGAVVALIEPVSAFFDSGSRLVACILKPSGYMVIIKGVLSFLRALRVSLVARFQRIFFTRSREAMKQDLMKEKSKKEEQYDQDDHRLSVSADIVELPIYGEDKTGEQNHSQGQISLVEHDQQQDNDSSVGSAHSVYSVGSDASTSKVEHASTQNPLQPGFFSRHNRRHGSSSKFGSFKAPDGTSSRRFGSFRAPSDKEARSEASRKNLVTDRQNTCD